MLRIDYQSKEPVYIQIKLGMLELIAAGALEDGRLPSVRALAAETGINPNTIQKAYRELESDGLITSISGKGSYASGREAALEALQRRVIRQLRPMIREGFRLGLGADDIKEIVDDEHEGVDTDDKG